VLESPVDLGLDAEVAQRDARADLQLPDLARELEALADEMEDAAVERLDVAPMGAREAIRASAGGDVLMVTSVLATDPDGPRGPPWPAGPLRVSSREATAAPAGGVIAPTA